MIHFYVISIVFGSMISWYLFQIYRIGGSARRVKHWKLVIGEVLQVERLLKVDEVYDLSYTISYSYEAADTPYLGTSTFLLTEVPSSIGNVKKGREIAILYDPADPGTSVLKKYHTLTGKRRDYLFKIGIALFFAVLMCLEYL